MTDRELILKAIAANQPLHSPLPDVIIPANHADLAERFASTLTTIGGTVRMGTPEEHGDFIRAHTSNALRVINRTGYETDSIDYTLPPQHLGDVDIAIIKAHYGVAENGAVWITDELLGQRVLPFICQELIVILSAGDIVPDMHEAYQRIGDSRYNFGTFIAGPSKTADIEQSLVLGAHGSRRMTVLIAS